MEAQSDLDSLPVATYIDFGSSLVDLLRKLMLTSSHSLLQHRDFGSNLVDVFWKLNLT